MLIGDDAVFYRNDCEFGRIVVICASLEQARGRDATGEIPNGALVKVMSAPILAVRRIVDERHFICIKYRDNDYFALYAPKQRVIPFSCFIKLYPKFKPIK